MDAAERSAEDRAGTERPTLSERDIEVLAFERQWWKYAGSKEQAVRELFGMSATRSPHRTAGEAHRCDYAARAPGGEPGARARSPGRQPSDSTWPGWIRCGLLSLSRLAAYRLCQLPAPVRTAMAARVSPARTV